MKSRSVTLLRKFVSRPTVRKLQSDIMRGRNDFAFTRFLTAFADYGPRHLPKAAELIAVPGFPEYRFCVIVGK